ncbi:NADH:flavin oxidoreductase [Agromyces aerolatus]|uniref:NADH:flavin oxidoreductase n=1 Tax=Agromyces sp. LY-1074 TaxID=3074080 RepID=UPI002861A076|nr:MULTISPECIES: NADH:flavin oxidoreductase [unclassified Agromyces]MDR5701608.1 NADH:flavin oxidoreductase [Agromyces sp. LY-1074]MDR5706138.1 NADH:flavin oxidoreductase [Agromyces sp. LY-1358]
MLDSPLTFLRGRAMPNRFVLAPMTNTQSARDGTVLDAEIRWLVRRARGGFGGIVTSESGVEARGRGFATEPGCHSDAHVPGLARLAEAVKAAGSLATMQLNHAGMRGHRAAERVSASADAETGARALRDYEIPEVVAAWGRAAARCEAAGFDGVQIHGAHGYLIGQFLSGTLNRRTDDWGGSAEHRARFLFAVIDAIRASTGPDFQVGVRLSPERYGQDLFEITAIVERLIDERKVDSIDLSLWDAGKLPDDERADRVPIMRQFLRIPRGEVRMGVAGRIRTGAAVRAAADEGSDYLAIGKAGILYPDFPRMVRDDPELVPGWLPVSASYLRSQDVGDGFIRYLTTWNGFISDEAPPVGAKPFVSAWSDEVHGITRVDAAAS